MKAPICPEDFKGRILTGNIDDKDTVYQTSVPAIPITSDNLRYVTQLLTHERTDSILHKGRKNAVVGIEAHHNSFYFFELQKSSINDPLLWEALDSNAKDPVCWLAACINNISSQCE